MIERYVILTRSDLEPHHPRGSLSPLRLLWLIATKPEVGALMLVRAEQVAYAFNHGRLADVVRGCLFRTYGADFVPGFEIGEAFSMPHPNGVVVGRGVRLGSHVRVMQHVTLGERHADGSGDHGYPTVGNSVVIGADAALLGDIRIGSGSRVGCKALVLHSAPEKSVLMGIPAVEHYSSGAAVSVLVRSIKQAGPTT